MFRLCISLLILLVIACNTQSDKTSDTTDSAKNAVTGTKSFTWNDDDEKEFLADCVNSAKVNLGDTVAYAQCHCVLEQLKKNFPTLDSADTALNDSTTLAGYISKCK